MILSKTSEYAIRAVTILSILKTSAGIISAPALSKESQIPLPYLSKILRKLVEAKILLVKKGPHGGFCFRKSLKDINLLSVLEAVDFELDQTHCPFGWKKCNSSTPCPLHESYSKLKKSYTDWARQTTLEKIAKQTALSRT